ncbi:helix-turn-helix domain-containing protein [Thiocapsa sp.]|uniref:helix-turn-helix domain-containing protein n=1 Tax=Thiocapsa sp. TaxID=2024551 RepID=UPI002CB204F1|nr:type II toxin-antitoxin system MqsA family antitoxin [Thiocapsa sp.]HSO82887.1 type II toxin-antitoxin system MqsA family antitoxin [Thiocapsa sp.]
MKGGGGKRNPAQPASEIVRVRLKSGLSRAQFAAALGVSKRTLEQREQGRRQPSRAAKQLLRIAERHPEVLIEIAAYGRAQEQRKRGQRIPKKVGVLSSCLFGSRRKRAPRSIPSAHASRGVGSPDQLTDGSNRKTRVKSVRPRSLSGPSRGLQCVSASFAGPAVP